MNIYDFWKAVLQQNPQEIRTYFDPDAHIRWHCTNECFTVDEFIIANCEYPGEWDGEVERVANTDACSICVVHVFPPDKRASFHVVSFIQTENSKIISMDEYWADDSMPPQWRLDKHIGTPIK